jgi:hypothetical protein
MEVQEMEGGVIAIKCIEQQDRGWLNDIPPLGTVNEDLRLTQEDSEALTVVGTYKVSQAFLGRFERFIGKIGLNDSEDQQSADNNDVEHGPDKVKGYENTMINLEMTRENNKNRIEGASKGQWIYEGIRGYRRRPSMRLYELITAFGPDVQSLDFTTAEMLRRYIGVRIERKEMEYGNPNKFRVPFFARRCVHLPNWAVPTPTDLFSSPESVVPSVGISVDNQIQSPEVFHTRLKNVFSGITTGGELRIRGTNFFGEDVEEVVTLTTGAQTYITKNYYNTIAVAGIDFGLLDGGTLQISEYDCAILPS